MNRSVISIEKEDTDSASHPVSDAKAPKLSVAVSDGSVSIPAVLASGPHQHHRPPHPQSTTIARALGSFSSATLATRIAPAPSPSNSSRTLSTSSTHASLSISGSYAMHPHLAVASTMMPSKKLIIKPFKGSYFLLPLELTLMLIIHITHAYQTRLHFSYVQ